MRDCYSWLDGSRARHEGNGKSMEVQYYLGSHLRTFQITVEYKKMPPQSFVSELRKFVLDKKPANMTVSLTWEDKRVPSNVQPSLFVDTSIVSDTAC